MSTIMNITSDDRVRNEDSKEQSSVVSANTAAHASTKRKGFFSRKNNAITREESVSVDESVVKSADVVVASSKKSSVKQSAKQQQSHQLLQSSQPNVEQTDDRFDGDGVVFNAKLIGHEFVAEARGEHMCQQSLKKLKILQRGLGGHKRRVQIFISFDGIKIRDAISSELLYHHSVPQISFISRDETDPRAFGYVFGSTTTGHQFIAIKTQKEAMPIMSAIGQLFAATLLRKKTEPNEENNVETKRDDTTDSEEKTRRESSITLRPSRSDSPNVPSMPAPPPPTNATNSGAEEHDFFAAFEPIDSDFESDWKVKKEQLDQISNSCDVIANDPFASSFGSLSLSSGDWANFDDDKVSENNASPLQRSHDSSNAIIKTNASVTNTANSFVTIPTPPKTKIDMPSSFNDSSSSMALNELFASGHHNSPFNQNSFPSFTNSSNTPPISNFNSEAVAIPARVSPKDGQQISNNQSLGSTTSSADRYACFAEIHSISSSIFDSLCDQIGEDNTSSALNEFNQNSNASKSLNSSLNGGFGNQHHLSSSYNGNYFSFENPLSNSRGNAVSNAQQINNVFNNESSIWFNSNMGSVSPSDKSNVNSQWSTTSSPSVSANIFANNRINEFGSEAPIFAELDPLGKDKPFVDRSRFFAEQKFKPTLKDLNNDFSFNESCDGPAMSSNIPSVALSWKTVNPFNDVSGNFVRQESAVSAERYSPNPKPFNPFNACDSQIIRTTPPPPIPPPRPPSRECPPVPPRTDLSNVNAIGAPPLPRRRISLEKQLHDQRPIYTNTQLSSSRESSTDSPPPIPNPQRRPSKKAAANWDPFNCAFVESQLSSMASGKNAALINCDNQINESTPKSNVKSMPPLRSQLKLSSISSPNNWSAISSSVDSTVFEDNFNDIKQTTNLEMQATSDTNASMQSSVQSVHCVDNNTASNHISPPERNIFIAKSDPFEDEFFAN